MDTSDLIKSWIAGLVRAGLAGAVGYFVRKGIIDNATGEATLTAIVGGAVVVGWSLWHKYHVQQRINELIAGE